MDEWNGRTAPHSVEGQGSIPLHARLHGRDILLIEDEPIVATSLAKLLGQAGAIVTVAVTLREARQFLHSAAFGALIIDLMLPDGRGQDLAFEAAQWHPRPKLIVLSGHMNPWLSIQLQLSGVTVVKKEGTRSRPRRACCVMGAA